VTALELRDVVVEYDTADGGRLRAVAGASISVDAGQIVGLVGESGCGKSTLARAAVGLARITSGSVVFEGRKVPHLGRRGRARALARLQLVFQNPYASLNPRRRVGSQLADALGDLRLLPAGQRSERARELCELVGLPPEAVGRFPHEFSGGQRQRIAVARALAAEPSVIVLDEPLASLDASAQAQLANLLVSLSRSLDLGLLLISHDLAIVRHVADSVSVMYLGKMVEAGPSQELWEQPLHPYSESLIGAIPHPDGLGFLPTAPAGEVPDPRDPPTGCRFHPRCRYAFDRCREEEPPLVGLAGGRSAACWLQPEGAEPAKPGERLKLVGASGVE
jgi:oligopeptide/dipeptide ABC transporter ATP-binding protein